MNQQRSDGSKRARSRLLSFNKLVPNLITLLAFCSGLSAMRFALDDKWETAVGFILLAAIFDGLDGRMARLLKAQSKFGAELDSLSDLVCFGVMPAVVLFLWSTIELSKYGWVAVLFFGICCILRLARFNVRLEEEKPAFANAFFTGVPAPAGAGLALLPMMVDFQFEVGLQGYPVILALWLVGVGLLMVSQVPTFAVKRLLIPQRLVLPILVIAAIVIAGVVSAPWFSLVIVLTVYLASIPLSMLRYRRLVKQSEGYRTGV